MKNSITLFSILFSLSFYAQIVNIPDADFKNYLLNHPDVIDTNSDNEIQVSEAENFTGDFIINTDYLVDDFTGLEAFINLNKLQITALEPTVFDISNNTALTEFVCEGSVFPSTGLSSNVNLTKLVLTGDIGNMPSHLDLTTNINLTYVNCEMNGFSDNTVDGIRTIDLSNCSNLTYLNCGMTYIEDIDLSANGLLETLKLYETGIYDLDLSNNTNLIQLNLDAMQYLSNLNLKNTNNQNVDLALSNFSSPQLTSVCLDDVNNSLATLIQNQTTQNINFFDAACPVAESLVTIPDTAFLGALLSHTPVIDTNSDGLIQISEAEATSSLSLNNTSISDLTGLEAFINLTNFILSYSNDIAELDLSNAVSLTQFDIYNNASLSCINLKNGNNINVDDGNSHLENLPNLQSVCLDDISYEPYVVVGGNVASYTLINDWSTANCSVTAPIVYIPDANFKAGIIASPNFVSNGDQEVQVSEALNTNDIVIDPSYQITDLTGIEAFTNAQNVSIINNTITTINLTNLTSLFSLNLGNNAVNTVDLSNNSDLQELNLSNNLLTEIDLSFQAYPFSSLDLSNNPNLVYINFKNGVNADYSGDYSMLNFSNLPNLTTVCVDDIANTTLTDYILASVGHDVTFVDDCNSVIDAPDNNFRNALLGHSPNIDKNNDGFIQKSEALAYTGTLNIWESDIYDLTGIENFVNVTNIFCWNNFLTTIDLSQNVALEYLYCSSNELISLDVTGNPNLEKLLCHNNQLTTLDVSANPNLYRLLCGGNTNLNDINLKNGNNPALLQSPVSNFENLPSLASVCVDDLAYTDLTNFILAEVGHTVTFMDNCATASIDNVNNAPIHINPNIVTNELKITLNQSIKSVLIYDYLGKLVLKESKTTIAVAHLSKGIYFVKIITNEGQKETLKFIKK